MRTPTWPPSASQGCPRLCSTPILSSGTRRPRAWAPWVPDLDYAQASACISALAKIFPLRMEGRAVQWSPRAQRVTVDALGDAAISIADKHSDLASMGMMVLLHRGIQSEQDSTRARTAGIFGRMAARAREKGVSALSHFCLTASSKLAREDANSFVCRAAAKAMRSAGTGEGAR
mmetsp:Transcript_12935/g.37322  ORF Transcript_12935/g.37322 Transcript_12935/m.37322 type:complete len:175 (-) Transcript_12935:29-553(-)